MQIACSHEKEIQARITRIVFRALDYYIQKAWDIAKGAVKSLPMNLFMMWMAGNTVHIFSLMMVFMLIMTPVKNLGNVAAGMLMDRCLDAIHSFVFLGLKYH